jgi:predicted RNA-binding Zn-ribbon protein involved in translation (DUF1610 family)
MKKEYSFPCKKCGAKLKFSPSDGKLKCQHCGELSDIQRSFKNLIELDYYETLNKLKKYALSPIKIKSTKCNSCAATFKIDDNIHSSICPYCGNAIVKKTELYKPIKPQALLPFKLTQRDARDVFKKWLKNLWFAPNKLKEYGANIESFTAIYTPYWTYDTQTASRYEGRRGDYYYVMERVTVERNGRMVVENREVRRTRWSYTSGNLNRSFNDVLIVASNLLKHKLSNWDLVNLVDYDEAYLSGFDSEIYSIELDVGFEHAKKIIESEIRNNVRRQIGGDEQQIISLNSQYNNITYKHILLPIYASAFKYNNKVYSYSINARTGEINGERPYSTIKIALATIAILATVGAMYYWGR